MFVDYEMSRELMALANSPGIGDRTVARRIWELAGSKGPLPAGMGSSKDRQRQQYRQQRQQRQKSTAAGQGQGSEVARATEY